MKEQTKITVLLITVIIVAVISLLFIFYEYGKLQSQFTARITTPKINSLITTNYYFTQPPQPTQTSTQQQTRCQKPNCDYEGHYRIGTQLIETGIIDTNKQNIQGCHQENTQITVQPTNKKTTQKIKCISGGWTLIS